MPRQWWENDTYAPVEDWEGEFYAKRNSYRLPLSPEDRRSIVNDCKRMKEILSSRLQFPGKNDPIERIRKLIERLDSIY